MKLVEFRSRSNQARRELTWAEVSVLEALRYFEYAGCGWDGCIEWVAEGFTTQRLGLGALIRVTELRRVGELVRGVTWPGGCRGEFVGRLRRLTGAILPTVRYQRPPR